MKTFEDWLKDNNEEDYESYKKDDLTGVWFAKRGLPMIVSCTCCGSTMVLPSAMVDEDGQLYCTACAD